MVTEYHPLITCIIHISYYVFVCMLISYVLYATKCLNKIFKTYYFTYLFSHCSNFQYDVFRKLSCRICQRKSDQREDSLLLNNKTNSKKHFT